MPTEDPLQRELGQLRRDFRAKLDRVRSPPELPPLEQGTVAQRRAELEARLAQPSCYQSSQDWLSRRPVTAPPEEPSYSGGGTDAELVSTGHCEVEAPLEAEAPTAPRGGLSCEVEVPGVDVGAPLEAEASGCEVEALSQEVEVHQATKKLEQGSAAKDQVIGRLEAERNESEARLNRLQKELEAVKHKWKLAYSGQRNEKLQLSNENAAKEQELEAARAVAAKKSDELQKVEQQGKKAVQTAAMAQIRLVLKMLMLSQVGAAVHQWHWNLQSRTALAVDQLQGQCEEHQREIARLKQELADVTQSKKSNEDRLSQVCGAERVEKQRSQR